jgi:glucose/arabinose dehydrogenase
MRIDPLGTNGANGKYGIPASNPFVGKEGVLGEIYASGVRNPQRFAWDSKDGRMYLAEIGQNQVEEISEVTAGGNLGWNVWEGSYKYVNRQVDLDNPRSEAGLIWPIVEYDHKDPLLQRLVAITGVTVYRSDEIKALQNLMIFGDNPSGELFYINADQQPAGGQTVIRRILLKEGDAQKTLLQIIKDKNTAQGKTPATRADLRFGIGADGKIYLLNKRDGIIRLLVPDGKKRA